MAKKIPYVAIKQEKLERPVRDPDHESKRGVPYWWTPEWVRDLNGSIGRIKAIKEKDGRVNLYMLSKDGRLTYIQGSIQQEFKTWHQDRKIDYEILGEDPDQLIESPHDLKKEPR